jgi:hypothetical protein
MVMSDIAVKLVASLLLIAAASLVGRRWGRPVAGWLVGLPLTSGPVVFFLAVDYGSGFARHAAVGALAGTAAQACFCLAYTRTAQGFGWPLALSAATVAFVLAAGIFDIATPSLAMTLPIVVLALAAALALLPRPEMREAIALVAPPWDIPARMLVVVGLVFGLGAAAPLTGPRLAGLFATYPVFATVLAVFAHQLEGVAAAEQVLRGLLIGLYGFAGFFSVVAFALSRVGIAAAFLGATATALLIQGGSLSLTRRRRARLHAVAPAGEAG